MPDENTGHDIHRLIERGARLVFEEWFSVKKDGSGSLSQVVERFSRFALANQTTMLGFVGIDTTRGRKTSSQHKSSAM
jgi:hypothetical protein